MNVFKLLNLKAKKHEVGSLSATAEATESSLPTRWLDPRSLQFQLGVTIALLIATGLSTVAVWTTWKVQQILIDSHKQNIESIGASVTHDALLYEEMMPIPQGVLKALENRASRNLLLWVQEPNGNLIAPTPNTDDLAWQQINSPQTIAAVFQSSLPPRIFRVNDRDFVGCNRPLRISNAFKGELFVAQDITADQQRFASVVQIQLATTISAIILMTLSVMYYLNRTLRPLQDICRKTQEISADDLENAQFEIHQAPTEIQQLADTCNLMLQRLSMAWKKEQQASDHQRQFVTNVAHELRTPLTVVKGYIQSTLRRGENLTLGQREALDIAAGETEHTVQVLQNLLDLARAEEGCIPYRMDHVILNDQIAQATKNVHQHTKRPIVFTPPPDLISAYTDATHLQQVLLNLLDNAVKYSDPPTPVTVTLSQADNYAVIEVSDRGLGIDPDLQGRIFERFFRVDAARTRSGGTGLGLSVVKTFVEGMKGHVSLRSELGKGATFTIKLPLMPS